jgi:hypothetical protein
MSCLKRSQFVCLWLVIGCISFFSACVFSVIKTGECLEGGSKYNFATVKSWGTTFVTQKFTRSGSLFLSDGQYVGSPVYRVSSCFSFHHFEYFGSLGCNESDSPVDMLSIEVSACDEPTI